MTDSVDIRQAAYDHLLTMPGGVEIVFSNTRGGGLPRYEVEPFGQVSTPVFLDGCEEHDQRLQVTAVVNIGTGETESGPMVKALADHFPVGTMLGIAKVIRAPRETGPIVDEDAYRVPVEIFYRAYI